MKDKPEKEEARIRPEREDRFIGTGEGLIITKPPKKKEPKP
ncbi:hypothetical protein [Paenibacillus pasadenensis]|nr:hypothetical protein [Paenibacillus pasadenensis]